MRRFFLGLILVATTAGAADTYRLAPPQLRQLQQDQSAVTRAYIRSVAAAQDLAAAQAKLQGDAERIRQANGWPDNVGFRPDMLTFYAPPPPKPTAAAAPEPESLQLPRLRQEREQQEQEPKAGKQAP